MVSLVRPAVPWCRGHKLRVKHCDQHDDNEQLRAQRVPTHSESSPIGPVETNRPHGAIFGEQACTQV